MIREYRRVYIRVLGLDKDKVVQKIVLDHEQTKTVKLIFRLFLEGFTPHAIAIELTRWGIKAPEGKDIWNQGTVHWMLSNETATQSKENEGEIPQYYFKGNFEAVIDPKVFRLVM